MTYLLDSNVIIDFQESNLLSELVQASYLVEIAVADKVFDEVATRKQDDPPKLVAKKRAAEEALRKAKIDSIEVLPGTVQIKLMEALLAPLQTVKEKDQGEAASIAIAASASHLVFVTGDKNATLWALNELFATGERVMRVPVFIRTLFERGALPAVAVKRVAERAASHGVVPSWWNSWLAAL